MTLVNANNEVMGHAAFFDYPNLPSVDQNKWEDWMYSKFDCDKCNVCIYFTEIITCDTPVNITDHVFSLKFIELHPPTFLYN